MRGDFDAAMGMVRSAADRYGLYLLTERRWTLAEGRAVAAFARAGLASAAVHDIGQAWGAGLTYSGWGRGHELGVALATVHGSEAFYDVLRVQDGVTGQAEWNLEATLRLQVAPWLAVQPNLQVIVHPGMHGATPAALVGGGRLELGL